MGGWKRDRGTRHGLVLLGYLAERPTMTGDQSPPGTASPRPTMDNTWPSDLRTFGDVHDRAIEKRWTACSVEHLRVLEDIFGPVQWLGRSWP